MADQPATPSPPEPSGAREPSKRRARSLPLLVIVPLVVGVLSAVLYSALAAARERARRANCSSNLSALCYTCQLYSGDYELSFPPDFDALFEDYLTDGGIFLCPSASKATEMFMTDFRRPGAPGTSGSIHPEHADYVYVSGLIAADPPEYVLLFEDEWNHGGYGVH
ncbi:MAG: hypothetical protein ACYS9X_30245, partial [Planctomycetota bacterium]